jgi:hypothetical protein
MSNTPQGLLFVFGQCEPDVSSQEFNSQSVQRNFDHNLTTYSDWYDGEHAPARLTVPGITSAIRYKATDGEKPEWLAIYDLATPETMKSPAYLHLRNIASDNEKTLIPRLPILQRRIYSLIAESAKPDLPASALPGKYLLVALWSVPGELDADFHRWYDEEHMEKIGKVPGWLRGRRYKLVDGLDLGGGKGPSLDGWDYLVMHEWENDDYGEAQEFTSSIQTPWAARVFKEVKGFSLRKFELYKNFERA